MIFDALIIKHAAELVNFGSNYSMYRENEGYHQIEHQQSSVLKL